VSKRSFIDYEHLVQTALRSVVREALLLAGKNGLPGNHHFYISYATDHPGVHLPDYLKEEYPDEITIVIQHEFWELVVEEDCFSVTLCFNDTHENLVIPFDALVSFVDPSVKFGLQFIPSFDEAEDVKPKKQTLKSVESLRKTKAKSESKASKKAESTKKDEPKADSNVVTLDAFRKKP